MPPTKRSPSGPVVTYICRRSIRRVNGAAAALSFVQFKLTRVLVGVALLLSVCEMFVVAMHDCTGL